MGISYHIQTMGSPISNLLRRTENEKALVDRSNGSGGARRSRMWWNADANPNARILGNACAYNGCPDECTAPCRAANYGFADASRFDFRCGHYSNRSFAAIASR